MYCPWQFKHYIKEGDSLYNLARYYRTTVHQMLLYNPHIDPYNLQIGTPILICPGKGFQMYPSNENPDGMANASQIALINNMRQAWEQHVYWTRMLLISIAERLMDQNDVTNRLLQNPNDIANIFGNYYSADIANTIAQLLTEHLQIGAELITALRDGKGEEADRLNRQWYENADKMASAFGSINPYYNVDDLREMFYNHLELTTQEVSMRLAGNYPADIEVFNQIEEQALAMADYFTTGIMQQFKRS